MIPPDHSVEAEGPRDICANLAQIFQGYAVYSRAEMAQSYPHPYHFGEWAARLRHAVQKLDAEKARQRDWRRLEAAIRWALGESEEFKPRPISPRTGKFTAGVYYWRDELRKRAGLEWLPNKRGAVSPTAPPAAQDTPQ